MRILSVNVGLPRKVSWNGTTLRTGIFKEPAPGPRRVHRLNFEGDAQADLSVHGGVHKAVYAYPVEHYPFWRDELPGMDLPWGMFGENLTTEGLLEESTRIGDRFRVGTAELKAVQPRLPCFKLGIKFGRDDIVKRFLASRRTGIYFEVEQPGVIEAGDALEPIHRPAHDLTIADLTRVFAFDRGDLDTARRLADLDDLPDAWRDHFSKQAERLSSRTSS
jgi:MOSC domain-containing protein YiiM